MTNSIKQTVQQFFEELPHGRLDSIFVSGDLCTSDYAERICGDLKIHCTYKAETGQFRFERTAWHAWHLQPYRVIVA